MMSRLWAALAASLLAGCAAGAPRGVESATCPPGSYAQASIDRWFQLSWSTMPGPTGPVVAGYVDNQWKQEAERMRLAVERLGAAGQVVGCSEVWVLGSVPAFYRGFFTAAVPDATAQYRVRILSFEWKGRGGS
jgi:hypothetical protein